MNDSKKLPIRLFMGLLALAILLGSCANHQIGDASSSKPIVGAGLSLRVASSTTSRSLLPSGDLSIASYSLIATGPGTDSFSADFAATEAFSRDGLAAGPWTFELVAKALDTKVLYSGTASATLVEGKRSEVRISLSPAEGTGSVSFALTWPEGEIAVPSAAFTILEAIGVAASTSLGVPSYSSGKAEGTASLAVGDYVVQVKLFDSSTLRFAKSYALQVLNERTTPLSLALTGAMLNSPIDAPTFDLGDSAFEAGQQVSIAAEPGAEIYYSTDGSDPFGSAGILYYNPITLEASCVLRARALLDGTLASATTEAHYYLWLPTPSPVDTVTVNSAKPNFDWADIPSAIGYRIQISSSSDFGTTVYDDASLSQSSFSPGDILADETTYYWRVRADIGNYTWGNWSTIWSFKTQYPMTDAPILDPPEGLYAANQSVTIRCSTPGASIYYSIDGSPPTINSTKYDQTAIAATVIPATTIRAIAVAPAYALSSITGASYGKLYYVGEAGPAGGIVFYDKGDDSGGWRFMEAAPSDQSTGIQWYNGSDTTTGAIATATGTGAMNTSTIVVSQGAGSYAAQLCYDLILGGKDDWFLPSKDDLYMMYINLKQQNRGNFASAWYWSSSEDDYPYAWSQSFGAGVQINYAKYGGNSVRAARAF